MQRFPVQSRIIEAVYFSHEDGTLRIRFHNGQERLFGGVPREEVRAIVSAPSPGKYYLNRIREKFPRLAA